MSRIRYVPFRFMKMQTVYNWKAFFQLYVCYPKGKLGIKGIEAIMQILQKPKMGSD